MALSEMQIAGIVERIMQRLDVPGAAPLAGPPPGMAPAPGGGALHGALAGCGTGPCAGSCAGATLRNGARALPPAAAGAHDHDQRSGGAGGGAGALEPLAAGRRAAAAALAAGRGTTGVFASASQAVAAARRAAATAAQLPLSRRYAIVEAMREACRQVNTRISEWAVAETGLGRVEDKLRKNPLLYEKTPGPEILEPRVFTGDDGLTLIERAPFGVIAAITPTTNPTETVICNAIGMVSGGNAVVFNAHPAAREVSNFMIDVLGRAIVAAGGPEHLVTCVREPTIESAQALMTHPGIRLLVVTGGPGVVKAALKSGKKVIAAGPGNPPAVVDATADLERAAAHIVAGATLDNNIVCIAEKEIIAVAAIADRLKAALRAQPVHELTPAEIEAVEKVAVARRPGPGVPHGETRKQFIGKNAAVILGEIGVAAGPELRMLLAEVPCQHPFVQMELMMPIIPLVRVADVGAAIDFACEVEHGNGHTATMHSRDVEHLSHMARVINTTIFVKNGPSFAGCGLDGEGYTSFTIASPTGEGLTTAVHFTRERRCTLKDSFRIV